MILGHERWFLFICFRKEKKIDVVLKNSKGNCLWNHWGSNSSDADVNMKLPGPLIRGHWKWDLASIASAQV